MNVKKYGKDKQLILNAIPIFLSKTYVIVNNPEYSDVICWTENGEGFIIKDIAKLTTQILPKHFKHNNFASFVRQLNMYGFRKIRSQANEHIFEHEFFQRDKIQELVQIKRKNTGMSNNNLGKQQDAVGCQMMVPMRDKSRLQQGSKLKQNELQKEIVSLSHKHNDLQNIVSILIQQNKEIIMQNRKFVLKMNKMDENYTKKLQTIIWLMLFGTKNGQKSGLPMHPNKSKMLQSFNVNELTQNNQAIQLFNGNKKNKKQTVDQIINKMLSLSSQRSLSEGLEDQNSFQGLLKKIESGKDDRPLITIQKSVNEASVDISEDDFLPPIKGSIPPSPIHSHMEQKNQLNDLLQKFNNEENSQFSISK